MVSKVRSLLRALANQLTSAVLRMSLRGTSSSPLLPRRNLSSADWYRMESELHSDNIWRPPFSFPMGNYFSIDANPRTNSHAPSLIEHLQITDENTMDNVLLADRANWDKAEKESGRAHRCGDWTEMRRNSGNSSSTANKNKILVVGFRKVKTSLSHVFKKRFLAKWRTWAEKWMLELRGRQWKKEMPGGKDLTHEAVEVLFVDENQELFVRTYHLRYKNIAPKNAPKVLIPFGFDGYYKDILLPSVSMLYRTPFWDDWNNHWAVPTVKQEVISKFVLNQKGPSSQLSNASRQFLEQELPVLKRPLTLEDVDNLAFGKMRKHYDPDRPGLFNCAHYARDLWGQLYYASFGKLPYDKEVRQLTLEDVNNLAFYKFREHYDPDRPWLFNCGHYARDLWGQLYHASFGKLPHDEEVIKEVIEVQAPQTLTSSGGDLLDQAWIRNRVDNYFRVKKSRSSDDWEIVRADYFDGADDLLVPNNSPA